MSGTDRASQAIWGTMMVVMVGCLAASLLPFVHALQPRWQSGYLLIFCGLAALLAFVAERDGSEGRPGRLRRLQEWLVRLAALLAGLQLYAILADPGDEAFYAFHSQALLSAPALMGAWLIGRVTAAGLRRLGEPPVHDPRYVPPERRLAFWVFSGGAALFLLSGLTHSSLTAAAHVPQAAGPVSLLNVLAYFVCAMVLLGRVRYAVLESRWEDRGMPVAPQLGRRWLSSSLVVLALLAVSALALSKRSTELENVPQAVATHVHSLFMPSPHRQSQAASLHQGRFKTTVYKGGGKVYWPGERLPITAGGSPGTCCVLSKVIVLHTGQPPDKRRGTNSWLLVLPAPVTIAIVIVLLMVGFLILLNVYRRVRPRRALWPQSFRSAAIRLGLDKLPALLRAMVDAWRRILQALLTRSSRLGWGNLSQRAAIEGSGQSPIHLGQHGRLSAREQVLSFYVSVLRHARRQGLGRKRSQTPLEFLAEMAERLPGVQADLEVLTEAFVEARYSQHPIEETSVHQVRQRSVRIKSVL